MNEVIVLTSFRVISDAGLVAASDGMDALYAREPGFVSRALVGPDADGGYLEIIRWRSRHDAYEAMAALARDLRTAPYLNVIDSATIDVRVLPIVTRSSE